MTTIKDKVELVRQCIKESDGVTYKEIAELMDVTLKNVTTNIVPRYFLNDPMIIKKREGAICKLYYKERIDRNAEGYADPTAAKAIIGDTQPKATSQPNDLMPGMTIWVNKELFIIYKLFSDTLVGWKVWAKAKTEEKSVTLASQSAETWVTDGVEFTVYTHKIMSITRSADTVYTLAGPSYKCSYEHFKSIVRKFGGNVTEVVTAKLEPIKVQPLEPVPIGDTDLQLARQAAEIWERAFMAMAGKLNV